MAATKTRGKKQAASRNGSSNGRSKGRSSGNGNGSAPEKGRSQPAAGNAGLDAMLTDATMSGRTVSLGAGAHGVAATVAADDVVRALGAEVADVTDPA